ncbi:MAG TPA: IPT/TIG domain-containing protein [Solirubrobacterales bacterium]
MRLRLPLSLSLVLLASLCASSGAGAQTTLGQTLPDVPFGLNTCEYKGSWDEFQSSSASGSGYVAPTTGAITSWSHLAGEGVGQKLIFKVFRRSGSSFTVVGRDERGLAPSTLNTFPVSIPVQAGDILGFHIFDAGAVTPSVCSYETGLLGDTLAYQEGNAADGVSTPIQEEYAGYRLNLSATLLPPPAVSGLSPAGGSVSGGTKVAIAGANFASVSAVSFGSVAATGFTVDSEGQITATAPKSKTLAKVPVTVTTIAGTATSVTTFAYEGCKVPKLKGTKLKASKKKLKKSDCKLGKLTKRKGAKAKTGKVVKQSAKPGTILAPGSKVKLTLKP